MGWLKMARGAAGGAVPNTHASVSSVAELSAYEGRRFESGQGCIRFFTLI